MTIVFTACEDDNGSNPTLVRPNSFALNDPVNTLVDLAQSTEIPFTWSQPDFGGWPAACEYQLEVSPVNEWKVTPEEAAADTTGATIADYAIMSAVFTTCNGVLDVKDLNKALNKIMKWEEGDVPEKQIVYVRCTALTAGAEKIYSNVVSLEVNPYYVDTSTDVSTDVEIWYLIGACIGNGSWANGADEGYNNVGISIIPMYPVYDTDGSVIPGEIQYVGYFPADQGFKLIQVPGDWAAQWGQGDDGFVKNDGGSSDIKLAADGYYMVHLNTATDELTITSYEGTVGVFTQIAMPGDYQGWDTNANLMTGMSTIVENHDWYLKDATFEDTGLKFAADNGWAVNWGGNGFPHGQGTQDGPNITVPAGTYHVYFNDILGTYSFVPAE